MSAPLIVTCDECGQRNRLPPTLAIGKAVICGRCKAALDDDIGGMGDGDDFDDDELSALADEEGQE